MDAFTFWNPVKLVFGPGVAAQAGVEAKALGSRALLVTGRGHVERSGLLARIEGLLRDAGMAVFHLKGVDPNPRIGSVREGVRLCREHNVDLVIGLGGGSCMDCAKAVAAGALYEDDPWNMVRRGADQYAPATQSLPTMMIPTLAATGSEMNPNAVLTNPEAGVKSFVSNQPCMFPKTSLADPELTLSVPADQTANGAADIIAHVLESYFNGADDTPVQDRIQEGIVQTVMEYAPKAIAEPGDIDARTQLQWASIVGLNGWAHAGSGGNFTMHHIEHVLSARYDIAHGAGLAILMPAWMKFACPTRLEKYVQFATRVFGVSDGDRDPESVAHDGIHCFDAFLQGMGLPTRLGDAGIGNERLDAIAEDAIAVTGDASGRLPGRLPVTASDVRRVLELAL